MEIVDYFKDQIAEELEGAKSYAKLAIEFKPMDTTWAKMFVDMSEAEIGHATNLYKMFEEYYKKITESYTNVPDYLEEKRECIIDEYTECTAKVRYILAMYNK